MTRRQKGTSGMATKNKTHSGKTVKNGSPKNVTQLRKVESLERLRDRVEAAANEIVRLRAENRQMERSFIELERRVNAESERPTIAFDEDPDALRQKVRSFIDAIDNYLDHEAGN